MKLTVFGATGRTGQHVVEQSLAAGHDVTAYARNLSKLATLHERLNVVQGDITDPVCVAQAIAGADAVISVLGPTENKPDYVVTKGMNNILAAMHQYNVKRLIISAGAGVGDPQDEPKLFNHVISLLLKLLSRHVVEDMTRVVGVVRQSDREWTIVRVPMLTDDPPTGNIRVGYVGKGTGVRISRADMAAFMLQQVASHDYLYQAPVISN